MDQLPRLGKRELICLLLFTCNYVVFVWRGFLFLWVLGMGYVILLWHSLSLPYNYFLLPFSIVGFKFCFMTHQSALFANFKGVIANDLMNWLRLRATDDVNWDQ